MATLSTNSVHGMLPDATPTSLITDETHAAISTQAILDVVESVRTGDAAGSPIRRSSMPRLQYKSFASPDEVRTFPNGRADIVNLEESVVGRAVYEPGWRWSTAMPAIAGTGSCQLHHLGYSDLRCDACSHGRWPFNGYSTCFRL